MNIWINAALIAFNSVNLTKSEIVTCLQSLAIILVCTSLIRR